MTSTIIKTYTSQDGQQVDLIYHHETLWLTQTQIAELFDVASKTISQHLHTIYTDRELLRSETSRSFMYFHTQSGRTTQRQSKFYNQDAAISVGYRLHTHKATHFRIWVSNTVKELVKQEVLTSRSALKTLEAPHSQRVDRLKSAYTLEETAVLVE